MVIRGNRQIFKSSATPGIIRMGWSWLGVFFSLRKASGPFRLVSSNYDMNSVLLLRGLVHLGQYETLPSGGHRIHDFGAGFTTEAGSWSHLLVPIVST